MVWWTTGWGVEIPLRKPYYFLLGTEAGRELRGRVPANAVVIPGTRAKQFPAGSFGVPCALIIGERKPSTDTKTSLNEALREFGVPV
mgnify:CR=1 FL=1